VRALYLTPLTAERDDLIPELGMGSEHAVIAVTVDARRMNEQSESLEELQRSERECRRTVRCGTGKPIDDALAPGCSVTGSDEPIECEGRACNPPPVCTVA
jgi:hypothetical protein